MTWGATRRHFLRFGSLAAGLFGARAAVAAGREAPPSGRGDQIPQAAPGDPGEFPRFQRGRGGPIGSASDRGKLTRGFRGPGLPPVPVEMPDLPKLPWKMVGGVKEYHLICEVVRRAFLPGQEFYVWGYNGSMPGPLIEAVQGDRIRIVVHNRLPEPTTLHWHGGEMPVRFDGVEGLTQEPIPPGESFAYEYDLHQEGSYFYHSHGAMQEIMGMVGMFVIHPRETFEPAVDHDFALIFQEFAILPQAYVPNSVSSAFNWFTINGRSGPYATPMVVRHGSRVRIRLMNLSAMDHHPIHFHGHTWWNTGTEGGRIPESAWIPGNTQLVGVAQVRDMEFIANNVGDWIFHCHIPHHMMNHMTSMTGPGRMLSGEDMRQMLGGMGSDTGMRGGPAAGPGRRFSATLASGTFRPVQLPAGTEAGPYEGQIDTGPALSPDLGPAIGHGLGPGTNPDHATRTGRPLGGPNDRHRDPRWDVPGWPLDMMDMKEMEWSAEELAEIKGRRETFGMRRNWFIAPNAMMTVLRVLPEDLYEKVKAGRADIPDGSSIPGSGQDEGRPRDEDRMRSS
jgi:FtsP/CotA-like multicopper oxidase with cupredoxin domain